MTPRTELAYPKYLRIRSFNAILSHDLVSELDPISHIEN